MVDERGGGVAGATRCDEAARDGVIMIVLCQISLVTPSTDRSAGDCAILRSATCALDTPTHSSADDTSA